jgi:hypothetical protein
LATPLEKYLADCWQRLVCPNCQKQLDPKNRVGNGRKRDGGFCSLDCFAVFYERDISARLKHPSEPNEHDN